ncbi:MAG: ornithine carbamoyltransferase [Proteobacteria bacterium]|nr:ornithine carbamoyltransferase [Pseudomonadota bacterium]
MISLISTESLSQHDLDSIFKRVGDQNEIDIFGTAACSFQGMGTRTRTTFIKALKQLGLEHIDLPAFLDTSEAVRDLAGYLDTYYDVYIIRYNNHEKLKEFVEHSKRPVINAMSSVEHPSEAIADAHWFETNVRQLNGARIVLWGPLTNVLRSWQNVATASGAQVDLITTYSALPNSVDLVVTDGWPATVPDHLLSGLELKHLEEMGNPVLLPTPPFTIGKEILFDPVNYDRFAGYAQKACLIDVQKAIIRWALEG